MPKEQFLSVAGFKKEGIAKMDLSSMSDEDLNKLAREKLLGVMANNGNKQRVIPIQSVESFISQGFEYVAALPGEKAIVRVPF
ncbi:MAG: hypothetical protein ACREBS_04730 [Nitrososphaerales archaeon]